MNKFFEAVANVFRIPDLRKRVLFTLGHAGGLPAGRAHPHAGDQRQPLEEFFRQNQGTVFGFIDLFSGGMFRRLTVFALGIMPYITASIILQLLTVVVPTLEKLQKEGELGRRKITQWTRYLTVGLALMQSFGIATGLQATEGGFVLNPGIGFILMTMLTLTTGTAFIMWLGEQITERGIGNGMSLIIFAGIVVGLAECDRQFLHQRVRDAAVERASTLIIILLVMVAVVAFIVLVERGERRIPVQYAKRVVGRRMMGGQSTHLPLEGERRRRDPGDLRLFAPGLPADPHAGAVVRDNAWLSGMLGAIGHARAAVRGAVRGAASFSSASFTCRSFSTRTKRPTTCASTAASSPASVRARTPPST